jgi:hypothetical protein
MLIRRFFSHGIRYARASQQPWRHRLSGTSAGIMAETPSHPAGSGQNIIEDPTVSGEAS